MVESGFPAARSLSRAERGGSLSLPMQYVFPEDNQTRNQINPDMREKSPKPNLWTGGTSRSDRDGIFKLLRNPGIDSKESIPPAYVAWRAGTTILFLLGSYGPHRFF